MSPLTDRTSLPSLLVLALLAVAFLGPDEDNVALDKLPTAVVDAVKVRFPDGQLVRAEKEKERDIGKSGYEVALTSKDQKIEISLTRTGAITDIEKEIAVKDLPALVARALETKYPQAAYQTIGEVTKVERTHERLASYEVLLVTADQKKLGVSVAPDGNVTREQDQDDSRKVNKGDKRPKR